MLQKMIPLVAVCLIVSVQAQKHLDPGAPASRVARSANCDSAYSDLSSDHTMCLTDVGTESLLHPDDITAIVNKHNELRNDVNPTATNLIKLVWDDDIAVIAAKWARQCTMGHDTADNRRVPSLPGVYIGQNAAAGLDSVVEAVEYWHSEVNHFQYGVGNTTTEAVGHYTQVVGYRAVRIGCGEAKCPGTYPKYQVCNYAMGQYTPELKRPYTEGAPCSDCPSGKCSGKLCDCGGKICLNGGTMDSKTCSCQCTSSFSGDQCQTENAVNCEPADSGMCTMYPESYCSMDFVSSNCKILCGKCPGPPNCDKKCKNGAELKQDCTCDCYADFSGPTCETLTCPPADSPSYSFCNDDAALCIYWNVKFMCPQKCGACS